MSFSSSSSSPPPPPLQYCSVCGQQSFLRCSRCLGALYCSVKCQKQDWKTHKVICKEAEKTRKVFEEGGYRTVDNIDAMLEKDRRLAEMGDAQAQYNVGLFYFKGLGVGLDKAEGFKWYKLAAEQGHAGAQFNLGCAYVDGEGVSVDKVETVKWYRLAAAQGEGVSVDKVESAKWYRLAADQGYEDAQSSLGVSYLKGEGVDIVNMEGLKWIKLAAENGYQKQSRS